MKNGVITWVGGVGGGRFPGSKSFRPGISVRRGSFPRVTEK